MANDSRADDYPLGIANLGFTVEELDISSPPPLLLQPEKSTNSPTTSSKQQQQQQHEALRTTQTSAVRHPIVVVDEAPPSQRSEEDEIPVQQQSGSSLTVPREVDRSLEEVAAEPSSGGSSLQQQQEQQQQQKSETKDHRGSSISSNSLTIPEVRRSSSVLSEAMSERLRQLRRRFETRASSLRASTVQPLTESESDDEESSATDAKSDQGKPQQQQNLDDLVREDEVDSDAGKDRRECRVFHWTVRLPAVRCSSTIDPQGSVYLMWLCLLTLAMAYNYFAIPLRSTFTIYDLPGSVGRTTWLCLDYLSDVIYVLDIFIKMRVRFVNQGILEKDPKACRKHYIGKADFKLDLAALVPLDLLYFAIGIVPIVRFPRLLKLQAFWELFDMLDKMAKNGHVIRIVRTILYMIFIIHVEACIFYQVSKWEGLGSNTWVYDPESNVTAYVYCFYFATSLATNIGDNPPPTNYIEYLFMTCYWLSGIFVFALLIGQIGEIVQAANANKTNYRSTMDITTWYMRSLNVPEYMLNKVRTWFDYNWEQQKTLDENSLLEGLPRKLRTDLAISVHFTILSKVSLFQDCERALLSDLILKLKPVLYLPGDYICRKGEVGMEMYIIMNGQVEVVGGPNNSIVFVTLKEGSVFGEISLMSLSGGNRRTADVRSKGFATLFTLSKADFEEAMQDYPQAYALLKKRAKKTLTKGKATKTEKRIVQTEEVIKEREPTPKLLKTVIQAVSKEKPKSCLSSFMRSKSKRQTDDTDVKPSSSTANQKLSCSPQEVAEKLRASQTSATAKPAESQQKAHQAKNLTGEEKQPLSGSISPEKDQSPNDDDADVVSQMSEESIHLPQDDPLFAGIRTIDDLPTPPPTSEDTPAALLERLERSREASRAASNSSSESARPPADRASVLDETRSGPRPLNRPRQSHRGPGLPPVD